MPHLSDGQMSDVFFAIPSCNPDRCADTFARWKARGYSTAVLVDGQIGAPPNADVAVRVPAYPGYGASVNILCHLLDGCDWIITGGDDVWPDPNKTAEQISAECTEHFAGTLGVMQPAGDAYGALADKSAAVSPWLGREFRRRVNQGRGPYHEEYRHFYDDTELTAVAAKLNCLWWRDDLAQFHDHWIRRGEPTPAHLVKWNERPPVSRAIFERRRMENFPGHELLPA